MANLFGMLASGAAQGYATGSAQNTAIEQKYAMDKLDSEVKALMEERIHERNRGEHTADVADERKWQTEEKAKDRVAKGNESIKSNSELQIYEQWKKGELESGKKPADVTYSKFWADKNHRTGSDSAIIAQAVAMSKDAMNQVDPDLMKSNYEMLKKATGQSDSAELTKSPKVRVYDPKTGTFK